MPGFTKGPGYITPFGNWNFLRSTRDVKTESYTVAADSVPTETIDGSTQKVLRKGEVLAKITSGPDIGKVGPYAPDTAGAGVGAATDGRGDPLNIVGINNTFLPWQLLERDVEVAAVYECSAVQAKCFERDAAGARVALTDATADDMRSAKGVSIIFK